MHKIIFSVIGVLLISNIKTAKNNFGRTQEKFKLGQVTSIEFRLAQLNLLTAELSKNQASTMQHYPKYQCFKYAGNF